MIKKVAYGFLGLFLGLLMATVFARAAQAATCAWTTDTDCDKGVPYNWTKLDASSMMYRANLEPYLITSGWFIDDNSPIPSYDSTKGYEGTDCSGFVFKVWGMAYSPLGNSSFVRWNDEHDAHGQYQATSIKNGCYGACTQLCPDGAVCAQKQSMAVYARFASGGNEAHVAVYIGTDSYGNETIGQSGGFPILVPPISRVHTTNYYRGHSAYSIMRRVGWP